MTSVAPEYTTMTVRWTQWQDPQPSAEAEGRASFKLQWIKSSLLHIKKPASRDCGRTVRTTHSSGYQQDGRDACLDTELQPLEQVYAGLGADLNCFDSFKFTAKNVKGLQTETLLSIVNLWREPSSVPVNIWEDFTVLPAGPWTSVFTSPCWSILAHGEGLLLEALRIQVSFLKCLI